MKIVFAGTPDFSVPPLRALMSAPGHQVVAVYTQPDRPAGRGRKLTASPVKQLALEGDIPVYQPSNFKLEEDLAQMEAHSADLMVVVAYGLLLPLRVLQAPRLGCINIHASLLPRWRGAAPIQRAISAGDKASGITIMQMEEGLDTGPMLLKKTQKIEADDTGGSLHDKLSIMGAEALMEALPAIEQGDAVAEIQDDTLANYARKLEKAESQMHWTRSAKELDRQVRAFNPWPVAQTKMQDEVIRVWQCTPLEIPAEAMPGEVLRCSKLGVEVACGEGVLRIEKLQMPGKRAMSAADFLNSRDLTGQRLGV